MANNVDPDQTAPISLFWVHAVCFYTYYVSNVRQLFAADDFSRRHFQMHFFPGALRVNDILITLSVSCNDDETRPRGLKHFSCSTQLSTKFQLLIKTKLPTSEEDYCVKSLRCCIYHANKC